MNENYTMYKITEFGGFWIRVLAALIDSIVLIAMGLVILIPIGFGIHLAGHDMFSFISSLCFDTFNIVMGWIYFSVFHSSEWQATIGKRAMSLKVGDINGNRISFGRATGRYFAGAISAFILFIGYMMVGWTKRKQGLHDKIAGTLVIRTKEGISTTKPARLP